jgi:hypothetical protein
MLASTGSLAQMQLEHMKTPGICQILYNITLQTIRWTLAALADCTHPHPHPHTCLIYRTLDNPRPPNSILAKPKKRKNKSSHLVSSMPKQKRSAAMVHEYPQCLPLTPLKSGDDDRWSSEVVIKMKRKRQNDSSNVMKRRWLALASAARGPAWIPGASRAPQGRVSSAPVPENRR